MGVDASFRPNIWKVPATPSHGQFIWWKRPHNHLILSDFGYLKSHTYIRPKFALIQTICPGQLSIPAIMWSASWTMSTQRDSYHDLWCKLPPLEIHAGINDCCWLIDRINANFGRKKAYDFTLVPKPVIGGRFRLHHGFVDDSLASLFGLILWLSPQWGLVQQKGDDFVWCKISRISHPFEGSINEITTIEDAASESLPRCCKRITA